MRWVLAILLVFVLGAQGFVTYAARRESRETADRLSRRLEETAKAVSVLESRLVALSRESGKLLVAQVHPTKYTEHTWSPDCDLGHACAQSDLERLVDALMKYAIGIKVTRRGVAARDSQLEERVKEHLQGLLEDAERRKDDRQRRLIPLVTRFVEVCGWYTDKLGKEWGAELLKECKVAESEQKWDLREQAVLQTIVGLLSSQAKE